MRGDAVFADDDCGRRQGRTGRGTSSVKGQACAEVLCSCELGMVDGSWDCKARPVAFNRCSVVVCSQISLRLEIRSTPQAGPRFPIEIGQIVLEDGRIGITLVPGMPRWESCVDLGAPGELHCVIIV